jgi:hypothetical protein
MRIPSTVSKRWAGPLAGAAAIFLLSAASPGWIDRKVQIENPAVAAALKSASAMPTIPESVARRIGPMLYADNMLTQTESDLILELLDNETAFVSIIAPNGESFMVPPLSAPARDFLALNDIPDLNALWLTGAKEMKSFVDVTILNPHVVEQIEIYFATNLSVAWRTAVGVRDYSYLTRTLNTAINQFRLSGPDTEWRGRALLYRAMLRVDQANGGIVPNTLYINVRPSTPTPPGQSAPQPAQPAQPAPPG